MTLIRMSLMLMPDMAEWLDSLVENGRFENKSQAIRYFIRAQMPQYVKGDKKQHQALQNLYPLHTLLLVQSCPE